MLSPLAFFIRLDKVIETPGMAIPVGEAVDISGTEVFNEDPLVDFLTVNVTTDRPTLLQVLDAWLDSDANVEDRGDVLGDLSQDESTQLNRFLMDQSQLVAKTVALRRLGYTVTTSTGGAFVLGVQEGAPASEKIKAGDLITKVNNIPTNTTEELRDALANNKPNIEIPVEVVRDDKTRTVEVTPEKNRNGETSLGVLVATEVLAEFPFNIAIDAGRVSGPSAGLAFALTIIDELSPGSLLGDSQIAATGSLELSGDVGPVGGTRLKAVAADKAGADLLFVPVSEVANAKKSANDMQVIGVETLDETLDALARNGGDALPSAGELAASRGEATS